MVNQSIYLNFNSKYNIYIYIFLILIIVWRFTWLFLKKSNNRSYDNIVLHKQNEKG